jgi:integrase-like protein
MQKCDLITLVHDHPMAGHPGRDKTIQQARSHLSWPGMSHWITQYSGLQKHCNVFQFWIVCSVALYGMEITLNIIERKLNTSSWLSNGLYFTQFESVVVEICPL